MARDLTAAMITQVQAAGLTPILFAEGEFVSGGSPAFLRMWTGYGNLTWDSKTWTGAGDLLSVTPIEENADLSTPGFTATLSGQSASNIATALAACRRGKPFKLWFGCLDSAGAVLADPYLTYQGRLSVPSIVDQGDKCTISITYEDRLVDLERPRERRWTSADQAIEHPEDRGFDFVPGLQESQDIWQPPH